MVREDFVSNSSSSSFIIDKGYFGKKHTVPTKDSIINAIRLNFDVFDWVHKNCYMQVVDMDEVRKNIKGKITYDKLCDYSHVFCGIDGFNDWMTTKERKLQDCVVNPDCKFFIYMGDNDCWGMIDSRCDDMTRFKSEENSCQRIFELLLRTLGLPFDKKSKFLHGNGHLG